LFLSIKNLSKISMRRCCGQQKKAQAEA